MLENVTFITMKKMQLTAHQFLKHWHLLPSLSSLHCLCDHKEEWQLFISSTTNTQNQSASACYLEREAKCRVQMETSKVMIIPLLRLLVWPHPQHSVQFLAPTIKKEAKVLQCAERRTTKLVTRLETTSCDMSCEEWQWILGLSSLKRQLTTHIIARASWGG